MMQAVTIFLALFLMPAAAGQASAATGDAPVLSAAGPTGSGEGPARAYYRWIDSGGRIQYTDFEPVGVPSELIPLTPADADDDAPLLISAEGSDARVSDPFHDQDAQILPIEHIGPCAEARRTLTVLHSSLPVYRDQSGGYHTAWRGDRYRGSRDYLDAGGRTDAIGAARGDVLTHCSDPEAFAREEAAFRDEVNRN